MSAPPDYTAEGSYPRSRLSLWKDQERNLISGMVSVLTVVVLCTALSQPHWFQLEGGGCSTHTLGPALFLHPGQLVQAQEYKSSTWHLIYYTYDQELKYCVTEEVVTLMQVVAGLLFLMVAISLMQLVLDVAGPRPKFLKCLRVNAVPSIVAVWVCVVAVGVCYHITTLLEAQQEATKPQTGPLAMARVQIKFDDGFYLLVFAGGMSVVAVGCNWLRPSHIFKDADDAPLIDEWGGEEGLETFPVPPGTSFSSHIPFMSDLEPPPPMEGHPPPPYTP